MKLRFKQLLVLTIALALLCTTLAGCGSTENGSDESPKRTITDMTGQTVEMPATIEKVFCDWPSGITLIMTLGATEKLVAAHSAFETDSFAWAREICPQIESVAKDDAPFSNAEAILNYSPDLVVTNNKDNIDTYLMKKVQGKNTPQYMKIENHPQLNDVWKNRVGKTYIVCDATPYDIVIGQMLMAITVEVIEGVNGVIALFGHYRKGGFSDNGMRQILVPSSDSILDSTLRTPSNGSRDLIHAIFSEKDGKEYLEAASYNYVDANSLEEFNHQTFNDDYKNQVYHFEQLEKMIKIPFPHRVLVLDNEFNLYYDSLDEKEYKPISTSGYIVLI